MQKHLSNKPQAGKNDDVRQRFFRRDLPWWAGAIAGWLVACASLGGEPHADTPQRFQFTQTEMAVPIELVFYVPSADAATRAAHAVFARLHELNAALSDYDPESELSRLSATSGEGKVTQIHDDLWRVLTQAQEVSQRSNGAFDVTVGPVVRLWRRARQTHQLPKPDKLQTALAAVGYQNIRLDAARHTAELLKPNMQLDLGGIAKGYAMAEALDVLRKQGIPQAMIHGGGDIALGDPPPNLPGWRIAIAPLEPGEPPTQYLWLARCAVSTSGDTWQYATVNGKRYSHVVDPHTGLGLTDHCLATIVGPDSTVADALGKVLGVLGPEKGLAVLEKFPGYEARILRAPNGKREAYFSQGWKRLPEAAK